MSIGLLSYVCGLGGGGDVSPTACPRHSHKLRNNYEILEKTKIKNQEAGEMPTI